jgi:ribosome recycling factor
MIQETKNSTKEKMQKSLDALKNEFKSVRSGIPSMGLFDSIMVDYYGNQTPLKQVANISIPEARLVIIQPWDKGTLDAIEKAIQKSELGFNPNNDGKVIRISIPPLNEERRKELVKVVKGMAENNKVSIRNIRRDANEKLKKAQKASDITEDDLKKANDEIQKLTDDFIEQISKISEQKENEIMEV